MSKKEIAVFSVIVAIVVGALTSFLSWDYQRDKADFASQCQQIANLSNAQDYHTEYGECYLVKGNRLIKVDL